MALKSILALIPTLWILIAPALEGQDQSSKQIPRRPEIIKISSSLVTVPVIVKDRSNRFVTGLSRGDFVVLEDGVRQEIANFSSTEEPFNVALLLDVSLSTKDRLTMIRNAALDFIKQLQPKDYVLIVSFDEQVHFSEDFTNDHRKLASIIHSMRHGIGTALYDAVQRTINEKLSPVSGRKAMVVFSDGVDTASRQATAESTLELVANAGIPCYAVEYLTFRSDSSFLGFLARLSGASYFPPESIENTSAAFALIAEELHHQYTLAYYPIDEKRDGKYKAISVNVNRTDLTVRARQGYHAPKE